MTGNFFQKSGDRAVGLGLGLGLREAMILGSTRVASAVGEAVAGTWLGSGVGLARLVELVGLVGLAGRVVNTTNNTNSTPPRTAAIFRKVFFRRREREGIIL